MAEGGWMPRLTDWLILLNRRLMVRSVMLFCCLFFTLVRMTAQNWEQICTGSVCVQDFNGATSSNPNNVSGVASSSFKISGYGATGQSADKGAWSTNTTSSYISFRHELSINYEYRLVFTTKTKFAGRTLEIGFGTTGTTSGITSVGVPLNVPLAGQTQPGTELTSEVFTVPSTGNYFTTIAPRGIGLGGQVLIDNYRIERRALTLPTFKFSTEEITITEGEEVSVCIEIDSPSMEMQNNVLVELSSSNTPHLDGFTFPHWVQFEAGQTTQQCFTIGTDIFNTTASYALRLSDEIINQPINIGFPNVLRINVKSADLSCSCEGNVINICKGESVILECGGLSECADYCTIWSPAIYLEPSADIHELSISVKPEESTEYTFIVSDANGNVIHQVIFDIEVGEPFEAMIEASNPISCAGQPISVVVSPLGNNYSYDWADIDIGNEPEPGVRLLGELGDYSVTVKDEISGCKSTANFTFSLSETEDSYNEILNFFRQKGFMEFEIHMLGDIPFAPLPDGVMALPPPELVQDEVDRFIQFNIDDATPIDLTTRLEIILDDDAYSDYSRRAFITGNDIFCSSNENGTVSSIVEDIEDEYREQELAYWIHLWESPNSEEPDKLFIQAVTPAHDGGFTPDSELMSNYIYGLIEEVVGEEEMYEYEGKSDQIADILFHQLADMYDLPITQRVFAGQVSSQPNNDPLYDCLGELEHPSLFLNVAGLPINLPQGAIPAFNSTNSPNYVHDLHAVIQYIDPSGKEIYSWGRKSGGIYPRGFHLGFHNEKNPASYIEFNEVLTDVNSGCFPCSFGMTTSDSNSPDCFTYQVSEYSYSSLLQEQLPAGSGFEAGTRAGEPVSDFFEIGHYCEDDPSDSFIAWSCIPPVSYEMLTNEEEQGYLNPFGEQGILLKIDIDNDGIKELIYGRFEGIDANAPMTYYIWNCLRGGWNKYIPISIVQEPFDAFRAFYNMIFIDDGAFVLHTTLDILSLIPIIGAPADFLHTVWYLVEGEYGEAAFALVGIIPIIGDGIQLSRLAGTAELVVNINNKVHKIRGAFKIKCLTLYTSSALNGSSLALHHIIQEILPPCNLGEEFNLLLDQVTRRGGEILDQMPGGATDARIAEISNMVKVLSLAENGKAIARTLQNKPELIRSWIFATESGLEPARRLRLFEWLSDGSHAANQAVIAFAQSNGLGERLVDGWRLLDDIYPSLTSVNNRRFDIELISKVTELRGKTTLLSRLDPSGKGVDALKETLRRFKGKCKVCGEPGNVVAHLDYVDEYLQSVFEFTEQFHQIPGFDKVMTSVRTGASKTIDAAAHQIRIALSNPQNITRFEPPLGNPVPQEVVDNALIQGGEALADFVADTHHVLADGLTNNNVGDFARGAISSLESLNELKSYAKNSFQYLANASTNDKFTNQLKAYFTNINVTDISKMNYIFDAKKLEVAFGPMSNSANHAAALSHVKEAFKGMYQGRAAELFHTIESNSSLAADFFGSNPVNYPTFLSLVQNVESNLYQFIKIQ
ncbi:MAG: hypothetical protein R2795_02805 [Saprospiraceae bacterium]